MSCDIFSHCQLTQALKFDEEVMFELVVVFKTKEFMVTRWRPAS